MLAYYAHKVHYCDINIVYFKKMSWGANWLWGARPHYGGPQATEKWQLPSPPTSTFGWPWDKEKRFLLHSVQKLKWPANSTERLWREEIPLPV